MDNVERQERFNQDVAKLLKEHQTLLTETFEALKEIAGPENSLFKKNAWLHNIIYIRFKGLYYFVCVTFVLAYITFLYVVAKINFHSLLLTISSIAIPLLAVVGLYFQWQQAKSSQAASDALVLNLSKSSEIFAGINNSLQKGKSIEQEIGESTGEKKS